MAQLHELLKQDQEPFHLNTHIIQKRSQYFKDTTLQLKKRQSLLIQDKKSTNFRSNLCKNACFYAFQNSPDVTKSPFPDFYSPVLSPCKSPNGAVFLHIPSKTAALLVEAAMRIHKSKPKEKSQHKNSGFGLFGSLLKRLRDRSKNKKRAIGNNNEIKVSRKVEKKYEDEPKQSSDNWIQSNEEKCSTDMEASTSNRWSQCSEEFNNDIDIWETRFCSSPFRFSLHRDSSSSEQTPEFCSPAASPSRHMNQEKENCETRQSEYVEREEEEEKEQFSPVSILDPPFEDDGQESRDAEEENYDIQCDSYANVQRAKQQLLCKLRRFEKLADLDPMELERKLLEGSDCEEGQSDREGSENEESMSLQRNHNVETLITEVFKLSNLKHHYTQMSKDMKRLLSDLIVEEKNEVICSGDKEVVLGRICNRLDSWRDVEFDTIDMMIELDFKREFGGWRNFTEQRHETAAELELTIFGSLVEELSEELLGGYVNHQKVKLCL